MYISKFQLGSSLQSLQRQYNYYIANGIDLQTFYSIFPSFYYL